MRNLKFIVVGLVMGGLILAAGSQLFLNQDEVVNAERESLTEVSLLSYSELQKNSSSLVAYGTVEAVQDQDLFFQMNGTVINVYANPGDVVKEGEILAKLDDKSMLTTLSQAEAAYDAVYFTYKAVEDGAGYYDYQVAENNLEMAEIQLDALYEAQDAAIDAGQDGSSMDVQIEIQEIAVEQYQYAIRMMEEGAGKDTLATQWAYVQQAAAGLESAQNAYDYVYLRAPFDGEITTLPIYEGQNVFATYSVGKIVNRDDIEAIIYLSTQDAAQISGGNEVLVDSEYEAYVFGISTRVDEYTGKLKVRIQMDGAGEIVIGDTVKIEISLDKPAGVTLVPLSSILFDEDDAYVFFYYDGKVYKRLIDAGDVLGNYVEVYNMPEIRIVEDVTGLRSGQEANVVL